jgi:hypothetical protein
MRSVLQSWSSSQIGAWQSLDASYRSWVASLMWSREQLKQIEMRNGIPLSTHYDPYFRLDMPTNCRLPPFVEPLRNPADPEFVRLLHSYLTYTRAQPVAGALFATAVSVDGWNEWEGIEPTFRRDAEDQIYEKHYELLWVRARLAWWQSNAATIDTCIVSARVQPLSSARLMALQATVAEEDKAIDGKWDRMIKAVKDTFAPRQAKPETVERLEGMKEIEKYEHDMDRSAKADASPSPSPHEFSH